MAKTRYGVTFRQNSEIYGTLLALQQHFIEKSTASLILQALTFVDHDLDIKTIAGPTYLPQFSQPCEKTLVFVDFRTQEAYEKFQALKIQYHITTPFLIKILLRLLLCQQQPLSPNGVTDASDMALIKGLAELLMNPTPENCVRIQQIKDILLG